MSYSYNATVAGGRNDAPGVHAGGSAAHIVNQARACIDDDEVKLYDKATEFCCANDDDGTMETGAGDACCGVLPSDQKLFTIGDQYCCSGVLSVLHPSFNRDSVLSEPDVNGTRVRTEIQQE